MGSYSQEHYRRVSPPSDSVRDERDRLVRALAAERAVADRIEMFPVLTAENASAAIDFQNAREVEHRKSILPLYPLTSRRAIRAALVARGRRSA